MIFYCLVWLENGRGVKIKYFFKFYKRDNLLILIYKSMLLNEFFFNFKLLIEYLYEKVNIIILIIIYNKFLFFYLMLSF